MDEELIKLCVVDHIQRLGLAEHFSQEIEQTLWQIYRYIIYPDSGLKIRIYFTFKII